MNKTPNPLSYNSLVYRSKALVPFSDADLDALGTDAAHRNAINGLHGFLLYRDGFFIQYLEGDAMALDSLMDRIKRDERHVIVYTAARASDELQFPNWSMQHRPPNPIESFAVDTLWGHVYSAHMGKGDVAAVWKVVDTYARFVRSQEV